MALGKKTGGRIKGSLNKRTLIMADILDKHNFNPIEEMIYCYTKAKTIFESYGVIYESLQHVKENTGDPFPVEDKAHTYLKIAADLAKDLANYTYPKLKSTEINPAKIVDDMTPEQKLEAMKEGVKFLEAQLNDKGSESSF